MKKGVKCRKRELKKKKIRRVIIREIDCFWFGRLEARRSGASPAV
jgi:hypothetical protein